MEDDEKTQSRLIKWRSFPGRLYAEMVTEALRQEGIIGIIKGEDVGILGGGSFATSSPGKVTIWINESDRKRAEEVAVDMLNHI